MKIKWLINDVWEVVKDVDPLTGSPLIGNVELRVGDVIDVDYIQEIENMNTAVIQLPDGPVMFGVPRTAFEVLD